MKKIFNLLKEKLYFMLKCLFVDICKAFFYIKRIFFDKKITYIIFKIITAVMAVVFVIMIVFIIILMMMHNVSSNSSRTVKETKTETVAAAPVQKQELEFVPEPNANNIYKTIDFQGESEAQANDILYGYISAAMARKYVMDNYDISLIHSFQVDLNNDGINEVVAYINSAAFCSNATKCRLFILSKTKTGYKNISKIENFNPNAPLYILKNKRYKDMQYNDGKTNYIAKYKNNEYQTILK